MFRENRLTQAVVAALPVLLTPLLLFAIAEGWLDFGGGEKDIILVFPYFIGTAAFFACALVLILKRWPPRRWIRRSVAVSLLFLGGLAIAAYMSSWLGVAGH